MKQIDPIEGRGRPEKNSTGSGTNLSRKSAAEEAGISKRQKDTAIRVASIPADEFSSATALRATCPRLSNVEGEGWNAETLFAI